MSGDKNAGGVESVLALVLYFAREGYWHHVQTVADQVIKKRGRAPVLSFWKAYAVAREGEYAAAIRNFDELRSKREVEYPSILALIWAHERTDLTDHEAINELSSAQRRSESRATPDALLLAATFKWLTDEPVEARRIVQLVIEREDMNDESRVAGTPTAIRALTLRGWIDLTCASKPSSSSSSDASEARQLAKRSIHYFDRALGERSNSKRDLEAMMGRAKYYENTGKFTESLESLNQAIVLYQWFHPALSEKAKVLVRMGDWDQAYDTAERVIQRDRQDIEALRIMLLHALLRSSSNGDGGDGDTSTQRVVKLISRLTESLERHEPMNADLYFECSRPLARLASRRSEILKLTLALVKRAQKLKPAESTYVTEFAYQSMLMGRLQRANDMYKQAASLDDANVDAVTGMIRCQLEGGQLVDAEQQIEFMREIQQSIGESPELTLLTALLAWRKDGNRSKAVTLLDGTLETFWRMQPNATSSSPIGTSWNLENIHTRFVHCNLDFLLQISREYLQHSGTEPLGASEQPPPHLTKGESTLCTVVSLAPGFIEAQFLLAKARYLGRKFEAAERTLKDCLRLDPTFSKAHLLMAQLHLKQDRPNDASKSLEQAKALDFEIRENPQFHLIQGRVADAAGDTEGAIKILQGALELPAMQVAANSSRKRGGGSGGGVTPGDRATLYICLTELYAKSDQLKSAMSLVKKAMQIFRGTPEEVRVLISSSELAVQSGQTKRGLALLQSVRANSPAYSKAQETMANVYLTKLHDKRRFIQCYEKLLAQNSKSAASHVMLGDAWMRIQEPDKAIAAYEEALAQNPNDAGLPLIIGRALVKTHDYFRAIQYYEDAVRRTRPSSRALAGLQLDLAELYRKLKKYEQAGRVMEDALEERRRRTNNAGQKESKNVGSNDETAFDLDRSKDDVKCLLLVSRIRNDDDDDSGAVESLLEAKELQEDIVQRVRGNMDENRSQRHQAAEICYDLATHYSKTGGTSGGEKALVTYQAALRHEESHEKSLIALAKLHLRSGDLDKCRQYCMTLTRIDSNNEEATMMLADMMFQKREFQPAIFHFQQLLQQRPDNFKGLYKLLQLLRRAGKIQEAKPFLEAAIKHSPQTKHRPGYQFCKGMFARYTNEVADAIRSLNQARKSAEWGEEAILNMVEVYLNPDNENIWEGMDGDGAGNANEGNMEAVRICERLLREIKKRPKSLRHEMLECHALIGTRQRPNIELALKRFHATLKEDSECVPALRGMSMALLMLKQTPKARNCLRRIHKMKYDPTFSEDFEVSLFSFFTLYSFISNRCISPPH
jgi:tetratricopeptide repeat protein 21B